MKRKKITKIILSALVMGAFSFVSLVTPFAKSVVIENISPLDRAINPPQFGVVQYGSGGSSAYDSYTNTNLYQQFLDASVFYSSGSDFGMSFPNVQAPFYQFTGAYNTLGTLSMYKEQSFTEEALVEYDGARILKIKFMFVVGFQSLFEYPFEPRLSLDHLNFSFDGHLVMDFLSAPGVPLDYVTISTFGADQLIHLVVDNQTIPFWYNAYVCEVDLSSFEVYINGTENLGRPGPVELIGIYPEVSWEGLPQYFVRVLTYQPRVLFSVVMPSDFGAYEEEIQLGENDSTLKDLENEAEDFKDKLNVQKPTNAQVADIIEIAQNNTPQGITQYFDFFDNNKLSADFKNLLLTMMLTALGIAFCGYALHGKR